MSRYELWQATRDFVEGRRRDTEGQVHGWIEGSWHEDADETGDRPRECLNGAIALAEMNIMPQVRADQRGADEYDKVFSPEATELKHMLAEVIHEQYPELARKQGEMDDEGAIMWFNDSVAGASQAAMNAILDKTQARLFERWWLDHGHAWPDLVAEDEHLDRLLPLA